MASSNSAPFYGVPQTEFICVEHPLVWRDVDKGIETMGGEKRVGEVLKDQAMSSPMPLYLYPEDSLCRPIWSRAVRNNGVVLALTVPRRTGRKRKRGSDEPFRQYGSSHVGSGMESNQTGRRKHQRNLLRSMQDNPHAYGVKVVGRLKQSHRYRSMADFQLSSSQSQFVDKVESTLNTYNLDNIKNFTLDQSQETGSEMELFPPPDMSNSLVSFQYAYMQNPAVRYSKDESGRTIVTNTQPARKLYTQIINYDAESIPSGPPPEVPSLDTQDEKQQRAVGRLNQLLESRPIWTRRALSNQVDEPDGVLKFAYQYVGYSFRSGPWRETVIKFGIDPRSDRAYRIYQVLLFQTQRPEDLREKSEADTTPDRSRDEKKVSPQSHIFDGQHVFIEGKSWQICDITDPLLSELLVSDSLRTTCDIHSDGWYTGSTLAKVKTIMKDKVTKILTGTPISDLNYQNIITTESAVIDSRLLDPNKRSRRRSKFPVLQASQRDPRASSTPIRGEEEAVGTSEGKDD